MIPKGIQPEQLLKDFLQLKKGGGHAAKGGSSFSAVLKDASDLSGRLPEPGRMRSMEAARGTAKGHALMARVKQYLQARSGNLDKLTADDKALDAFGRVLLSAGFDENAVMDMIAQLKQSSGESGIKLSDLFARLSGLEETAPGQDNDLAAISALPFLESILTALGLDSEKIEAVLSGATIEGEGIHLSRLVSGLKMVGATVLPAATGGAGGLFIHAINAQIKQMMQQLGIGTSPDEAEGLTIDKLTMQLEALMARTAGREVSPGIRTADINRFFTSLKVHDGMAANVQLTEKLNRQVTLSRLKVGKSAPVQQQPAGLEKGVAPHEAGLIVPGGGNARTLQSMAGAGIFLDDKAPGSETLLAGDTGLGKGSNRRNGMEKGFSFHQEELRGPGASTRMMAESGKAPAGKSLPAYVLNQVGRQIIRSVQQNQTEVHLQLKPPHLGRLRMSLETVNDGMRISIMTEHQSTREMLRAHTGELRTALMEQGVRLEKIDVQVAFNFEQSMANTNKDLKRFGKRRDPGFDMEQDVRKLEKTMPLNRPGQAWRPDGNLHLIA